MLAQGSKSSAGVLRASTILLVGLALTACAAEVPSATSGPSSSAAPIVSSTEASPGASTAEPQASGEAFFASAYAAALDDASVEAEDALLVARAQHERSGSMLLTFEFVTEASDYEAVVEAVSGTIVSASQGTRDDQERCGEATIDFDEAERIVLDDEGIDRAAAREIDSELDCDGGTPVYQIDITTDADEYGAEVDAITGAIIGRDD